MWQASISSWTWIDLFCLKNWSNGPSFIDSSTSVCGKLIEKPYILTNSGALKRLNLLAKRKKSYQQEIKGKHFWFYSKREYSIYTKISLSALIVFSVTSSFLFSGKNQTARVWIIFPFSIGISESIGFKNQLYAGTKNNKFKMRLFSSLTYIFSEILCQIEYLWGFTFQSSCDAFIYICFGS